MIEAPERPLKSETKLRVTPDKIHSRHFEKTGREKDELPAAIQYVRLAPTDSQTAVTESTQTVEASSGSHELHPAFTEDHYYLRKKIIELQTNEQL